MSAKQEQCDHKFVGSKNCVKCGWTPSATAIAARLQPLRVAEPTLTDEERAERAWKEWSETIHKEYEEVLYDSGDAQLFKAGYLAALKERGH